MPDDWCECARAATPALRRGDLAECDAIVAAALAATPATPFHAILERRFTNPPDDLALWLQRFGAAQPFPIAAVYVEMNGFDINPGEWFCDPFAYRRYGGHDDYDWLASMDSEGFPPCILTGMGPLQAVYADERNWTPASEGARGLCSLLIVVRFQALVSAAARRSASRPYPILATAHDYDFIAES